MGRTAVVIGAGFAGMSAACFLAKAGYSVRVLEKLDGPGGRCRVWEKAGYRFDMGPSWYWMPDVFERFFAEFGKRPSDYYQLRRLDPSYRVFFEKEIWDIPSGPDALGNFLENKEAGAAASLKAFLDEAEYKYEAGMKSLVFKPGRSLTEFADKRVLKSLFKLDLLKPVSEHLRRHFRDPGILQLLEFPVLFLGAKPAQTPALYSLMNYADIALGTWYPEGGMQEISKALHALALELGVEFRFNTEVDSFSVESGKVTGVWSGLEEFHSDVVVAGADYHHIEQHLLPKAYRNYSGNYWKKRVMAPSSLLFFLGIDTQVNGLQHHNLFFDADFNLHAEEIYDRPAWPSDPLFYVCCPSKTDPTVAPEGKENLFVLIPLAPGLEDSEQNREAYFHKVMERLEERTGVKLREHIEVKRSYAMQDFSTDYHAFKGNAYGLANTLRQTAILKPSLKNKHLDNLYYTGQLTVPGPGVPPALISGEVVSNEIVKEHPISIPL